MKKVLTVIAVLALISTASFAQTKFGVKLGTNFANVKYDLDGGGSISPDSKVGFVIGGFANFSIVEEKFAIQPELLFSGQGFKMDDDKVSLNYLSVPVIAKYYFGGFNVQAGPQLGFLMSAKDDGDDIKDNMKGIDLGMNIGAGYDLEMGLGFDARYYMGMSNISDVDGDDGSLKNKGFQITVSYAF